MVKTDKNLVLLKYNTYKKMYIEILSNIDSFIYKCFYITALFENLTKHFITLLLLCHL